MLVVMALGGDTPIPLEDARRAIARIAGEHTLVVTHSNGPDPRLLAKWTEAHQDPHTTPAGAARLLEMLKKEMPGKTIASVVTEIEVRLVPVGPHYVDTPDGRRFVAAFGWMVVHDGTGFRRCIPTPEPQQITQVETINALIKSGALVICSFGEGIATMESKFGLGEGDVQIDEDMAAALLAEQVGADVLMLLGNVDVERVEVNWPEGAASPLGASTDDTLRRISFEPGLMGPKAEATCRFVESTGKRAAIGPLAQAPEILRGDRGVQVAAKSSVTADVGGGGRSVTVLVADDNDVALRLCRRVLQKAGYKVLTATDGLKAVSVALADSPDVILMDVAMPGIDGLEATRRIKQQRPDIAIVIASVLATASNRERFLASGADDVLMPPLRLSDMIAAIATLTADRGPQMKGLTGTRPGSHGIAPETLKGDREVQVAAKSSGTAGVAGGDPSVTVLVADDNDVVLRLCRRTLEKAGYKVLTASDGLEAVSVALANSPDVILMDVAMPGIDGLDAMRRIKQQRPGIAIVIASVLATPSNREVFLAAGAAEVMMKPFRLADMLAAVARLTPNRGPQMKDATGTRVGSDELEGRVARTEQPTRRASPVRALREMVRKGIAYLYVKRGRDQLGENTRRQFRERNRIGIALSAERDSLKLQEFILTTMRRLTNADSASLWLKTVGNDGQAKLFLSASQSTSIDRDTYQGFNVPVDEKTVVGYAVTKGTSQVYDDAYNPPSGKPRAGRGFDARHGYRTKSMLTVPMRNYNNEVVGAVQLINAKRSFETKLTVENVPAEVVSFRPEDLEMLESIASQAAIALDNKNLLNSIESLFDGFVRTSLSALELRDPSAASRSRRVEVLTTSLARAVSGLEVGRYRDVRLTEDQFKELSYACLLHDVGVIGVREYISIKTKKLLPGQLEVIQARFDFLVRSVQVKFATEKLDVMRTGKGSSKRSEDIDRRMAQEVDQLHRWMAAIVQANEPSVLPEETASILEQLSKQTYQDLSGTSHPMLDPHEFRVLSIRKGVLDPEERHEMESHVTHSFELVKTIPWPPSMRNVPEIVFAHHEKLDGSGYPRGLTGDQISLQARMLTIADIYDALTAQDRPYKRAVPTAVALEILLAEANAGKLDKDLLDVFVSKEIFLTALSQRASAAESPGTADVGGGGRSVTVLVADDYDVARRMYRRVLEKAGYKVLTASEGRETVSLALAHSPDMILLDVAMPGMDVLEAMRQIKEQRPGIAIVIASAHLLPSDRERFLALGADDMLIPPLRVSDLIAVVARLTANRGPQKKDVTGPQLGSHASVEQLDTDATKVSEGGEYETLDALLHDKSVSEIMVNGPDEVFIERRGIVTRAKVHFDDETQLLETIQRLVATTGQHIDVENPIVEAYLPDGSRVNAIIPPASNRGPALTIRKFAITVLTMNDLTREGTLSPAMAEFLQAAVLGRLNILVSGAAGSGKTATLNVLARFVPHNQRVITIEEGAELQIGHPHVVSLLHSPGAGDDEGEPKIRQLLHQGTRMLPDRILFGEVRGAEAIDLLEAMNNGQDGSMSTISSKSASDALYRLETMARMASIHMPLEAVRAQMASAVNLIVHQVRLPDGRRKIVQIAEVVGYDANGVILRDIFLLAMGSDMRLQYNATGYVPTSLDKAAFFGVMVSQDLFDPVKSRFIPAGSDTMMPVVKDPPMSGQRDSGQHSQSMASTPQMQEEMRKLIDAARLAVADLQAAASQPAPQPPPSPELVPPSGIPEPPTTVSTPEAQQEMRKLIDAARAAVADLKADLPGQGGASPGPKASKKRSTRRRT